MDTDKKITILLADDHEIFRNGVEHLINNEPDMKIVATAVNGLEALQKGLELQPDIILMDISMPIMTGLEAAAKLMKRNIKSHIIFFSLYDRDDYVLQSLKIGVKGYMLKDSSNKTFLKSIRQVMQGDYFYSGDLTNLLVGEYLKKEKQSEENEKNMPIHLSNREIEILNQIRNGKSNKDLATAYNVSTRTIETHRLNIMRRLGVKHIENAIELAIREGII
ncbi:MAG: response regulator transcription factor [Flavobacteriaceae bacterium]|jgi:DNA-binding NarL/FixJ family response regulator|nr:response regulator transcription factor [Flavobacteriaceae bacterium]